MIKLTSRERKHLKCQKIREAILEKARERFDKSPYKSLLLEVMREKGRGR